MTEEGIIKRQICDYLALFPNRCLFTLTPRGHRGINSSKYSQPGWPDITGVWDSMPLFIEVKTPKGKLRPEQAEFIKSVSRFRAYMIIARDVKDVQSVLK